MSRVFIILLIMVSVTHLYASWKNDKKLRALTKPFLLIFIGLWYLCRAEDPDPVIVAAIFFGWLGDVLLIPTGTKWFAAGGISFMLGHALYVAAFVSRTDFSLVRWYNVFFAFVVYLLIAVRLMRSIKNDMNPRLYYPMLLYLAINGVMNIFALTALMCNPRPEAVIAYIGAILFFISDCCLFLVRFHKPPVMKHKHFSVMLTYILAEFMIVYGLSL